MAKILVVDDEERMRKLVGDFLRNAGHEIVEAPDGEAALDIFFKKEDFELVILDVMMPRLDGYGVVKELREYSKVPIIMLTAKGEERDELLGFKLGVDEYVSKPFSPKILVARVEALLRRTSKPDTKEKLEAAGIVLDRGSHRVTVDGTEIELSAKEFELLGYFIENAGIALSREQILSSVWEYDYDGDERTIDTHVKKLRAKIGPRGDLIKTVWGIGYKFEL